ncbi:hypothetical protein NP493_848g02039 [Ridgeia piscesae]|uniref:G-protein coupled receptors family 1 profile domain-containing protein n=1 Tax=Ridgeia piscesae TaxID=27915 RepID=A0AAD9KLJ8_RIDPI|nr:hypothetical protein NP493_848g02039 [Ridgeia piscesae]
MFHYVNVTMGVVAVSAGAKGTYDKVDTIDPSVADLFNASSSYEMDNATLCWSNANDSACAGQRGHFRVAALDVIIGLVLSCLIVAIIIGNTFVILSVSLFRDMRTLSNGLIVSLATADLLVAIIVLPISLYVQLTGEWQLGFIVCDFWVTADVFCCTASILNIVVIALDRYWLIARNVKYTHGDTFTRRHACVVMVTLAWLTSGGISASPLFGWQAGNERAPGVCLISQDMAYTIFSTFGAFWFPLSVIVIVYFKIFKIARRRQRTRARGRSLASSLNSSAMTELNGKPPQPPVASNSPPDTPTALLAPPHDPRNGVSLSPNSAVSPRHPSLGFIARCRRRRAALAAQRDNRPRRRLRSSARTLGLIIGGFLFCWMPFFIIATVTPFCESCQMPPAVGAVTLWLGYFNSLLNPIIYAIWDKNFKRSFRRLSRCDIRWSTVL